MAVCPQGASLSLRHLEIGPKVVRLMSKISD